MSFLWGAVKVVHSQELMLRRCQARLTRPHSRWRVVFIQIGHYAAGSYLKCGWNIPTGAFQTLGCPGIAGVPEIISTFGFIKPTVAIFAFHCFYDMAVIVPGKTLQNKGYQQGVLILIEAQGFHLIIGKMDIRTFRNGHCAYHWTGRPKYCLCRHTGSDYFRLIIIHITPAELDVGRTGKTFKYFR